MNRIFKQTVLVVAVLLMTISQTVMNAVYGNVRIVLLCAFASGIIIGGLAVFVYIIRKMKQEGLINE